MKPVIRMSNGRWGYSTRGTVDFKHYKKTLELCRAANKWCREANEKTFK